MLNHNLVGAGRILIGNKGAPVCARCRATRRWLVACGTSPASDGEACVPFRWLVSTVDNIGDMAARGLDTSSSSTEGRGVPFRRFA